MSQELIWYRQGSVWVLAGDRQKPAPNKAVLRGNLVQFWKKHPHVHTWSERVKCPYTDIEEAKVWAKREYLLNYAE